MTGRLDFGETRFACIAADPPWPETGGGGRGAQNHYDVQRVKDIPPIMRAARDSSRQPLWLPAMDAHLYLWTTSTMLEEGLWVMRELAFRYVNVIPWVKDRIGIGQYFRGKHELLLFGVRGDGYAAKTERRDIANVIEAPVPSEHGNRIHSRKPPEAYELMERRTIGPRLELFARKPRKGWAVWGNEIGHLL